MDPLDELLPDSVIEKHTAPDTSDNLDNDDPDSAADNSPLDDDDLDTLDEDPDSGEDIDDTDDDDAGDDADLEADEEDDDDLDEEDDDLDELDEDEEDELDTDDESPETDLLASLPKFDRKKLEAAIAGDKSGELGKAYKHLRALATQKTMAAAEQMREFNEFTERVQTPEGGVAFLKDVVLKNPAVAAVALEQIATGEGALSFLVEVGLANRETFEAAYDKLVEFDNDPSEAKKHTTDRELRLREERVARSEEQRKVEAQRARASEITTEARRLATKVGFDDDDMKDVQDRLRIRIRANKAATGRPDVTNEEIKAVVREVRDQKRKVEERVRSKYERTRAGRTQDEVRSAAQRSKRPTAPKAVSPAPRRREMKIPRGVDPLDFAVDSSAARLTATKR